MAAGADEAMAVRAAAVRAVAVDAVAEGSAVVDSPAVADPVAEVELPAAVVHLEALAVAAVEPRPVN